MTLGAWVALTALCLYSALVGGIITDYIIRRHAKQQARQAWLEERRAAARRHPTVWQGQVIDD
jgi:hypothetical protein